jgi:hypothetical protein
VFLVAIAFLFACEEAPKPYVQEDEKKAVSVDFKQKPKPKTSNDKKSTRPLAKIIPKVILPGPCPDPDPGPGFLPDPYPIDPPGFLEPVVYIDEPPRVLPKNILDSLEKFPSVLATFGAHPDELLKYIDYKIANSMEWSYLKELGIEGKIYIRLLIDVKGKVRDVTFLKFSDKELEILKNGLNTALRSMPNWTPAKNENGQNVVSEYTFPFRIQFE